jgi:alkyl hydroperoxide reductase subunit AhpF
MTEQDLKLMKDKYIEQLKKLLSIRNIDLDDSKDIYAQQIKAYIDIITNISEQVVMKEQFKRTMASLKVTI